MYGTHGRYRGAKVDTNTAGGIFTVVVMDAASGANGEIVKELAPATRKGAIAFMRTAAHEASHYYVGTGRTRTMRRRAR